MNSKEFYIDEAYLCSVPVNIVYSRPIKTNQDLIDTLKNPIIIKSFSTIDHPEFTKLREQLGADGYIEIERGWWNGDRVLKQFRLNGFLFRKNSKFPCAEAMRVSIKVAKKHGYKTI